MATRDVQWDKLRRLLGAILPANPWYAQRLPRRWRPRSIAEFVAKCPLLTKHELVADREAHPPYGTNLTWPLERYTRFCQTSGTTGRPLPWLDTPEDWAAMLRCWQRVYAAAGVVPGQDRAFFAFTFGPFLGFWTAFEAALGMGVMAMPGGGLSSTARLQAMAENRATVLCCTPTYAVRLGEARVTHQIETQVRLIIVAGEPGGSIEATRRRMTDLWPGAVVFDHHGLTEAGPVTHEEPGAPGFLRVLEDAYFAEILDAETGLEVPDGGQGELVLTTLDRLGCPLLRYRTGDMVVKARAADGGLLLAGGILGRTDDMVVVRGVNVYPTAIEGVLRLFPEVSEYQVREEWIDGMLELRLVVEFHHEQDAVLVPVLEKSLTDALALRIPVEVFPPGSLPRFEFKARRWVKAPGHG